MRIKCSWWRILHLGSQIIVPYQSYTLVNSSKPPPPLKSHDFLSPTVWAPAALKRKVTAAVTSNGKTLQFRDQSVYWRAQDVDWRVLTCTRPVLAWARRISTCTRRVLGCTSSVLACKGFDQDVRRCYHLWLAFRCKRRFYEVQRIDFRRTFSSVYQLKCIYDCLMLLWSCELIISFQFILYTEVSNAYSKQRNGLSDGIWLTALL